MVGLVLKVERWFLAQVIFNKNLNKNIIAAETGRNKRYGGQ